MMIKVLLIIPAFNEEGNIERTLKDISSVVIPGVDIKALVVDDGSSDHTASLAKKAGANVLSLPFNLGIGGAVQAGYRYAENHDIDIAIQIDGDGQHDPSYLKQVITPILENKADMVIGSRFLKEAQGFRSTALRRMGIKFFSWLIYVMTGVLATDPTSGFRACSRRLIKVFAHDYPSDFPEPEALVIVSRLGGRVTDVPVVMRERLSGKSSIGKLKSPYYMLKVTTAILLHFLRPRKAKDIWK